MVSCFQHYKIVSATTLNYILVPVTWRWGWYAFCYL